MSDFWMKLQLFFGKKYATCKLFNLNDCGTSTYGVDSQGIDVYDNNYIFQGSDQNGKLASLIIIDINTKKIIGEFKLNLANCHMNNINIGKKLNKDSKFPLLYISECRDPHRCYVINIKNDLSSVDIKQTITFKSNYHFGKSVYAFDWFVRDNYIYASGLTGIDGEIEIVKFKMPSMLKKDVTFTDDDVMDSFKIQDCYVYQGTKMIGLKLFALYGYDTKSTPMYLKIINLEKHRVEESINIKGLGELEGLGIYKDGILVSNNALNPTYTYIIFK